MFSIIGIIILAIIVLSLGKLMSFLLKFLLFALLLTLVLVFFFGLSFADLASLANNIIMWAF